MATKHVIRTNIKFYSIFHIFVVPNKSKTSVNLKIDMTCKAHIHVHIYFILHEIRFFVSLGTLIKHPVTELVNHNIIKY